MSHELMMGSIKEYDELIRKLAESKNEMEYLQDDVDTVRENIESYRGDIKLPDDDEKLLKELCYREKTLSLQIFTLNVTHQYINDTFTKSYNHENIREAKDRAIDVYTAYLDLVEQLFIIRKKILEIVDIT